MAEFVAYFGKNSNAPAKKLGDHLHSGISLTPFGKKQKMFFGVKVSIKRKNTKSSIRENSIQKLNI